MKNLVIICVVLTLLNSFRAAGYDYNNKFRGFPGDNPLQAEAFVNSYLPIDSFLIPDQSIAGIINILIKTDIPILIFARIDSIYSFHLVSKIHRIKDYFEGFSSNLSLIKTTNLRI